VDGATFSGGVVFFGDATFSGGVVSVSGATFAGTKSHTGERFEGFAVDEEQRENNQSQSDPEDEQDAAGSGAEPQ